MSKAVIKKYVIFLFGGGIGTLLYLLVVYFMVELLGFWYISAYCLGSLITITFNFTYHRSITFGIRDKPRKRFLKFAINSLIIGFLSISLIYFLTDKLGLWYILSGIIGVGLMSIINFLINNFRIFQGEKVDQYGG